MITYMLDTTFCIASMNGLTNHLHEKLISNSFNICLSAITIFELNSAINNSMDPSGSKKLLRAFLSNLEILSFGARAAATSNDIRVSLKKRGLSLGHCDNLIAGHAKSESLTIITANKDLFIHVNGLTIENWLE